jgi:hypothetical protein
MLDLGASRQVSFLAPGRPVKFVTCHFSQDLSNNHLKEIPDELDKATGLLVLNLSNNM